MYNFPSQFVVTLYLSYSAAFRCKKWHFTEYFTQNHQLPRWNGLADCRLNIVPRFLTRGGIHKAPGDLLRNHVLFILLVGVHVFPYLPVRRCTHCVIILEVVFFHKFLWYHGNMYHDIFCSILLVVQVKMFYVYEHVSWFNVWDGAFNIEFNGC